MQDENTIRKELEKINKMSRVANGEQPLNGIEHTLLWILGEVDPFGRGSNDCNYSQNTKPDVTISRVGDE